jgi:hypothetical protein
MLGSEIIVWMVLKHFLLIINSFKRGLCEPVSGAKIEAILS